ncbi:hypothetical protein [Kribbella solani]|nr:hypothetical protein [Kribbella solani]
MNSSADATLVADELSGPERALLELTATPRRDPARRGVDDPPDDPVHR